MSGRTFNQELKVEVLKVWDEVNILCFNGLKEVENVDIFFRAHSAFNFFNNTVIYKGNI